MKRRDLAICFVVESVVLVLFQSHLGHALPMQLSMFTGTSVMAAEYLGGILIPAILFLVALHAIAFGCLSLVKVVENRTSPFADLGSKLLLVFSIYFEVFSVVLLAYCFDLSIKGILLSMASFSLLAVVLVELFSGLRTLHLSQHN